MANLLNKVKKIFRKQKKACWGWFGQRAHDALGINEFLLLEFIVCCDWGKDTDILSRKINKVFSIERKSKVRSNWSNKDISRALLHKSGDKIWRYLKNKGKVYCICYRAIRKIEELSRSNKNIKMLASSLKLKDYLDDKVRVRKNMHRNHIDVIYGESAVLSKVNYNRLSKKYGKKIVVQLKQGSSGMHTFLAKNEQEFRKIKRAHFSKEVNITKFIPRGSYNINAAVLNLNGFNDIVVTHPSVQLVGIKECSRKPFIYCGNDYTTAKTMDKKTLKEIYRVTVRVGAWLKNKGFRGIYGLDLLVERGKVYVLEINPRFQNSTSLLTLVEIKKKRVPLEALHILEFMGNKDIFNSREADEIISALKKPIEGAQLIIHNNKESRVQVGGGFLAGIYSFNGKDIRFRRDGLSILDCRSSKEFLITCAVPQKEKLVEKDAPVLKIQALGGMLNSDLKTLNSQMKEIVNKVYEKLNLLEEV